MNFLHFICFKSETFECTGMVDDITPSLDRTSDKLQNAIHYAIDGDQSDILGMLMQRGDETWLLGHWQKKRPLLHLACERGRWYA